MLRRHGHYKTQVRIYLTHLPETVSKREALMLRFGLTKILKMHFPTQIGHGFIIKMSRKNGTRYQVKQIIMGYILMNKMETEHTFYCLRKMLHDMVIPMNGLLMLKMNNCPFHLTARLGGLRVTSPQRPPLTATLRQPPDTPRPRRPTDEERNKHRRKVLGLPSGLHPDEDDEEEKENRAPVKEEEEEEVEVKAEQSSSVHQLLTKLGEAIDQLTEQVYRDLKYFKQRLGIPTSS
uniref:E4 protein n=1 Tax=Human papillomavirus TaxID=10566 RepID=A0A385PJU9_9PAPI|nr:MAG: E4 protein [Human papillomavirus]